MTQDSPHRVAPLGRRQVLMVFGGVMLAMLPGSLDQTVVATALLIAFVLAVFKPWGGIRKRHAPKPDAR